MKKSILFLCLLLLFGAAGSAGASPVSYVGGHMTFTYYENGQNAMWGQEIDVVNVWEVTQFMAGGKDKISFRSIFSSDMGPDYNHIPGMPMEDGPFIGFSASFDFNLTRNHDGVNWSGDGTLTMYDPLGNIVNPDPNNPGSGGDRVLAGWNGQFGDTGAYFLQQTNSNYFQHWCVSDIVTYQQPGPYSVPTNDYLYETETVVDNQGNYRRYWKNDKEFKDRNGDLRDDVDQRVLVLDKSGNPIPTNSLAFYVPVPTSVVPEPPVLLLLGSGMAVMAGLKRRR